MKIEDLKGFIDFPSGFKLLGPSAVDARFAGEDEEFLTSLVEANAVYPGLKVYIKSTNQFYSYTKDDTGEFSFKVDSVSLTPEQQAALDSGITKEKVNEISEKYVKPESGIPASDLASDVSEKISEVAAEEAKKVSDSVESKIRIATTTSESALSKATQAEADISTLKSKDSNHDSKLSELEKEIDSLPTEEKVISLIAKKTGRTLSSDANGNTFTNSDQVHSGPWFYGGNRLQESELNEGDQAFIPASEGTTSKTMVYTGNGSWGILSEGAYGFTSEESAVLASGATKEKIDQIETNMANLDSEILRAKAAEEKSLADANTSADSKIANHNTSEEAHQDLRTKISGIETLVDEAKTLGQNGISKADAAQETANTAKSKAEAAQSTADTAKTSAENAKEMVNTLEEKVDTSLVTKQNSIPGGGESATTFLMQPVSSGGDPRTLEKSALVDEINTQKIQPVKQELQGEITSLKNKNVEQDNATTKAQSTADEAKLAAEAAQSTADSKISSIVESDTNGSISVDGVDVPVHGLKNLAYRDTLNESDKIALRLGNVDNTADKDKDVSDKTRIELDKKVNLDDFEKIKERVNTLERLGSFVGAFDTPDDLPKNISEIVGKYGVSATINDFVTVRSGPYELENVDETSKKNFPKATDSTCWSIVGIDSLGAITWAYEFTYSTDLSGKIDVVTGNSGKLPVLNSDGQLEASDKSVDDLVTSISKAQTKADEAFTKAEDLANSKYDKPGTNGIPESDLSSYTKEALGWARKSIGDIKVNDDSGISLEYTLNDDTKLPKLTILGENSLGLVDKPSSGKGFLIIDDKNSTLYSPQVMCINEKDTDNEEGNDPFGMGLTKVLGWLQNDSFANNPTIIIHKEYTDSTNSSGFYGITPKLTITSGDKTYYFPKVRTFIKSEANGETALEEVDCEVMINKTTGAVTITTPVKMTLLIVIE